MTKVKTFVSSTAEDVVINDFIKDKKVINIIPFIKRGNSAFLIVYEEGTKKKQKLNEDVDSSEAGE